ncbi:P-loop containing nucleoside triphosphate hydrolase protein [Gigaspora margarita]|uniref:DNA repair protein RAD50 n=1 Tax=Gigaspora margarita TaxID=4874 RepID=A0A8H3X6D5_GIGMA|nr:P-loop containing nucleoside triphosphate hydrolase protein [Gigaspora margarita]
MSSLERIQIYGIRSFNPVRPQVVVFQTPLTIIVGPNGSGKTTIIECLKYATTGDLPPGAKVGGAFIHDPTLVNETEVKGQVKLQFKSINGKQITITRSMQAKVTSTNAIKATTIETLLQAIDPKKPTQPASLSTRCADLDREIPILLGVSRAVLDNVIFCHQEESTWPLSEPTPLKKRFDEIFSATRWTKAIGNITELRKKEAQKLREDKLSLEQLRIEKERAAKIQERLNSDQARAEELQRKMVVFNVQKDKNSQEINELIETIRKLDDINADLILKNKERITIEKQIDELSSSLKEMHESDEELMKIRQDYANKIQTQDTDRKSLERQKSSVDQEISTFRSSLNSLHTNRGQLQAEQNANDQRIENLEKLVREISRKFNFKAFLTAPLTALNLQRFKDLLQTTIEEKKNSLTKLKERAQQNESELNEKHNKIRSEIESNKNSKKNVKTSIEKNRDTRNKLTTDLNRLRVSDADITINDSQLLEEESALKKIKQSIESDDTSKKLPSKNEELQIIETKISSLDDEISRLHHQSNSLAKLDLQKSNLRTKTESLNTFLYASRNDFKNILGKQPELETLEKDMDDLLNSKNDELKQVESENERYRRELSTIDGKLQMLQSTQQQRVQDNKEHRKKLNMACGDRDLPDVIIDLEKELNDMREELANASSSSDIYNKFVISAQQHHDCPLCDRGFENDDEFRKFLKKINDLASVNVTEKITELERQIRDSDVKLKRLRELLPVWNAVSRFQSELSDLERQVEELQNKKSETDAALEDIYVNLAGIQVEINNTTKLRRDADKIINWYREIENLNSDIVYTQDELSNAESTRTVEDCTRERDSLQDEAKKIRRDIVSLTQMKEARLKELNTRSEKVSRLKLKLQSLKSDQENYNRLQKEITLLNEEIKKHEDNVKMMDAKISELTPKARETELELSEFRQKKVESEMAAINDLTDVQKQSERFFSLDREIEEFTNGKVKERLANCNDQIEKLEQQIATKTIASDNFAKQLQNMDKQASDAREIQRSIDENLKYRRLQRELSDLDDEINKLNLLKQRQGSSNYKIRLDELQKTQETVLADSARYTGELKQLEEAVRRGHNELDTEYKDINDRYADQFIVVKTSELGIKDLEVYGKALDNAIMRFHTMNMEKINKIIAELWVNTYVGEDIDRIEIRSEEETTRANRSYNYRVVMIKKGRAIDMRGRCSAGQKMLASIIIRLALAETFCINCGVFVLDEPTTNLDEGNIEHLAHGLRGILDSRRGQSNFQLIVITHDVNFSRMIGEAQYSDKFIKVSKKNGYSAVKEKDWQTPVSDNEVDDDDY